MSENDIKKTIEELIDGYADRRLKFETQTVLFSEAAGLALNLELTKKEFIELQFECVEYEYDRDDDPFMKYEFPETVS